MILGNDDRGQTMHTAAAHTNRELLPATVAAALDRNDQRCTDRAEAWRRHRARTRAREAAFERITVPRRHGRERERSRGMNRRYGLEL